MSITADLKSYADKTVASAQAQLNDVTGQANELVTKLSANATELRGKAEKAINLDAVKAAVEPYLEQVKGYQNTVAEKAEALLEQVKSDPRVTKFVETVQDKVVTPVRTLTNRGSKPAAKPAAAKAAPAKAAAKPATKSAARKSPAKKVAAKKA